MGKKIMCGVAAFFLLTAAELLIMAMALPAGPDDSGGWYYHNEPAETSFGSIIVNCTHPDTKGQSWTSY